MKCQIASIILILLLPLAAFTQVGKRIQIPVGHGPEDMVLDTTNSDNNGNERLLISCAQRRKGNDEYNGIWEYDFTSGKPRQLTLVLKEERRMAPHGISMMQDKGQGYLFVVNHIAKKDNEIIRFRVTKDTLYEEKSFKHKLLSNPNDVYALTTEEFYYSNDNMLGGSVGHCIKDEYVLISKGHSYANGVQVIGDTVCVSTTTGNKIFKLNPAEGNAKYEKEKLFKVKGGDNFILTERGTLLVTSHPRLMKFLRHAGNYEKKSPSKVYELDLKESSATVVYHDRTGNEISACSTALEYKGYLYLSQVFDPYLLRISLSMGK